MKYSTAAFGRSHGDEDARPESMVKEARSDGSRCCVVVEQTAGGNGGKMVLNLPLDVSRQVQCGDHGTDISGCRRLFPRRLRSPAYVIAGRSGAQSTQRHRSSRNIFVYTDSPGWMLYGREEDDVVIKVMVWLAALTILDDGVANMVKVDLRIMAKWCSILQTTTGVILLV